MELTVQESKKVDDGKHEGVITAVEYREKPYSYTDVIIEFEDNKIKAGFPTAVSSDSRLGRLLLDFKASLEIGKSIDPEKILVGKKCQFMTMNKKTDRGTFPEVVAGSLKPC